MNRQLKSGRIVNYLNDTGSEITAGAVVVVGDLILIAVTAIADGARGALRAEGLWRVDKAAGSAWTLGAEVFFDETAENFTATAPGNKRAGIAVEAAVSAATVGRLLLNACNHAISGAEIGEGAVATAHLQDEAVTLAKSADLAEAYLIIGAVGDRPVAVALSGDVTIAADGTVTIGAGKIASAMLAAGAVISGKIAALQVTESKIGAGAVIESKLGDGAVTVDKIGAGACTTDKIPENAIVSNRLAGGAVTFGKVYSLNRGPWNNIADPGDAGAIGTGSGGTCHLETAGAETRTLADPQLAGQEVALSCKTYVGDCVVTVANAVNQAGNDTLTFSAAGEIIRLQGINLGANKRWRVIANDGVALSTA